MSFEGDVFYRASMNEACCLTKSILKSEDGTQYRWPIFGRNCKECGENSCKGGSRRTYEEWLNWIAGVAKKNPYQIGICINGWLYKPRGILRTSIFY